MSLQSRVLQQEEQQTTYRPPSRRSTISTSVRRKHANDETLVFYPPRIHHVQEEKQTTYHPPSRRSTISTPSPRPAKSPSTSTSVRRKPANDETLVFYPPRIHHVQEEQQTSPRRITTPYTPTPNQHPVPHPPRQSTSKDYQRTTSPSASTQRPRTSRNIRASTGVACLMNMPSKYKITNHNVDGDGSCFYRAVICGLRDQFWSYFSYVINPSETMTYTVSRKIEQLESYLDYMQEQNQIQKKSRKELTAHAKHIEILIKKQDYFKHLQIFITHNYHNRLNVNVNVNVNVSLSESDENLYMNLMRYVQQIPQYADSDSDLGEICASMLEDIKVMVVRSYLRNMCIHQESILNSLRSAIGVYQSIQDVIDLQDTMFENPFDEIIDICNKILLFDTYASEFEINVISKYFISKKIFLLVVGMKNTNRSGKINNPEIYNSACIQIGHILGSSQKDRDVKNTLLSGLNNRCDVHVMLIYHVHNNNPIPIHNHYHYTIFTKTYNHGVKESTSLIPITEFHFLYCPKLLEELMQ